MANKRINNIVLPDRVVTNYLTTFIRKMNVFYSYSGKKIPHFVLFASKLVEIDILGVLLLYKFLEYSVNNQCFYNPTAVDLDKVKPRIAAFGFGPLISGCFNDSKKMLNEYNSLKPYVNSMNFLISPIRLYSGNKNREEIEQNCFRSISGFYSNDSQSDMIFMVMSELVGNFYSHSNDKGNSIIVAYGNQRYVEIACADSGDGITKTLCKQFPNKNETDILDSAVKRGISSKPRSDHMGNGLWLIDETVRRNGGRLLIYSNNACFDRIGNKKQCFNAPLWNGSIVYVKLDILKPINISEIIIPNNRIKAHYI